MMSGGGGYTSIDNQKISGSVPAETSGPDHKAVKFADSNLQMFPSRRHRMGRSREGFRPPPDADDTFSKPAPGVLLRTLRGSLSRPGRRAPGPFPRARVEAVDLIGAPPGIIVGTQRKNSRRTEMRGRMELGFGRRREDLSNSTFLPISRKWLLINRDFYTAVQIWTLLDMHYPNLCSSCYWHICHILGT